MNNNERQIVINELHEFIKRYKLMNLNCNISMAILDRNESIIRDFLNSFETFMRSE